MAFNPKDNILHNYASYTYKVTMYMVPKEELDTILRNGATFEGINLQEIHTHPFSKKVILVESGATSISLNSLSLENAITIDHSAVSNGSMQLIQPKGFSLFESIIKGASMTQSEGDPLKHPYYLLEITFTGIDDNGNESMNIYTITLPIQINTINTAISSTGVLYDVAFVVNQIPSMSKDSFARIPSMIQLTDVHNTDDLFSKLEKAINLAYERDTTSNQKKVNVCHFIIDDELQGLDFDTDMSDRVIGDIQMDAVDNSGLSFHIPDGYSIARIVESILANIPEVSDMLLNGENVGKLLHVEPHVVPGEYDSALNSYVYDIYWFVSLKYDYKEVRPGEASKGNTLDLIAENGDLSKVYQYIYTGENTEVKNIELNFSDLYNQQIASYNNLFSNYANTQGLSSTAVDDREERFEADKEESMDGTNDATPARVDSTGAEVYYVDDTSKIDESMLLKIAPRYVKETSSSNSESGISNMNSTSERTEYLQELKNIANLRASHILSAVELDIRGDPHWLTPSGVYIKQDSVKSNRREFNLFYLRVGFPIDEAETDDNIHIDDYISSLYQVHKVKSEFNNGVFSQQISATRLNHLRRSAIEAKLDDQE